MTLVQRWAWRLFKGLLSLPLLGLLVMGAKSAVDGDAGGLFVAIMTALLLAALWAELIGARRLEAIAPWLALPCGLALIAGAYPLGARALSCEGRRQLLCHAQQGLQELGGPWLAGLPYALLGAVCVVASVRALRKLD